MAKPKRFDVVVIVLYRCGLCQRQAGRNRVCFARRGDMASNRREDHKISMLALYLNQNFMVYIKRSTL